ncbi:hypothetical protein [Microcystis aeruginosa]
MALVAGLGTLLRNHRKRTH